MQGATYINIVENLLIQTTPTGTQVTYVLTPQRDFSRGLNLAKFIAYLRLMNISASAGVTLRAQWSADQTDWKDATTAIGSQRTTNGNFDGEHATATELAPYYRIVAEIVATGGSTLQQSAVISVWGYYLYRT